MKQTIQEKIEERVQLFEEEFGSKTGGAMPSGLDTASSIKSFLRQALLAHTKDVLDMVELEESQDAMYEGGNEQWENGYNAAVENIKIKKQRIV
jgi:hypothetical protein